MKKVLFMIVLFAACCFIPNVKAYDGFKLDEDLVRIDEGVNTYQIEYSGDFEGLKFVIDRQEPIGVDVATVSETGLVTVLNDGIVNVSVQCKSDSDSGCYEYIYKIKNELTILVNKTRLYEHEFDEIETNFLDDEARLATEMNKIPTDPINVSDMVQDFMSLIVKITDDTTGELVQNYAGYGHELISSRKPNYNNLVSNVNLIFKFVENKIQIYGVSNGFSFSSSEVRDEGGTPIKRAINITIKGAISSPKEVTLNFVAGNEADKKAVLDFAKTFPVNHKSYINLSDKISLDDIDGLSILQFAGSDAEKLIEDNGIEAFVDPRRGVAGIEPFEAGFITFGKNGIYYTSQEFKMWSTLKISVNNDEDTINSIKAYFEKYLDGLYELRVEKVEQYTDKDVYRLYIKEKEEIGFFDKIMNFLAPRVFAADVDFDKVLTFAVENEEETEEVENPETIDNLPLYVTFGTISLISLVGYGLYLNKKRIN